jgi:hypothetical protein
MIAEGTRRVALYIVQQMDMNEGQLRELEEKRKERNRQERQEDDER